MENKVYCKAIVQRGETVLFHIFTALTILLTVFLAFWFIPSRTMKEYSDYSSRRVYEYYNPFGVNVAESYDYDGIGDETIYIGDYLWDDPIILVPIVIWGLIFVPFVIFALIRSASKKCALELNQDGILGQKKKLFAKESLNMPFEKIDSVYLKNGIIDKILGGQTIVINTASSKVKFLCIDNAQEFVDKTLEELKRYKESVSSNKEKASVPSDENAMDAILKLKNLLDQGLITPEEFEEKRKSFINRI